jgi:hypothetical protein
MQYKTKFLNLVTICNKKFRRKVRTKYAHKQDNSIIFLTLCFYIIRFILTDNELFIII